MQKLSALTDGGVVYGMSRDGRQMFFNSEDTHSILIGATRSGKTRCNVLQTICLLGLAGESIVASDPKGELYLYTAPFLERLGYEVIAIDFKNPARSNQYNFLQPVIDAVNVDNIPLAVMCARDLVAALVKDDRTEQIWTDGQRSTIAAGILAVVVDNKNNPQYQNLNNVFHFLSNMCRPVGDKNRLPLVDYLQNIGENHPARAVIDISRIAPSKMRGSFYTSALTTLELFTDPNICDMTSCTDFDCYATGKRKRAIFIILPDQKTTYYPIASLFVYQCYQMLADEADKRGNRLPRRVNFELEEFGNFVKIPDFRTMLTVGGGRGIRFNLVLQDFNQLDDIYGDKPGKTIRSNCENWIYLQTDNGETLRELSDKLGKYTIKSPSLSGSTGGNMTASYNFTGRELLTPDEIKRIRRPYQLVMTRNDPTIMYAPDISQTIFNPMLGLGNKKHNEQLVMRRSALRPERKISSSPPLWGIWNKYIEEINHKSQCQSFGVERYF